MPRNVSLWTTFIALQGCLWLPARGLAQLRLEAEDGTLTGVQVATAGEGYSGAGYVTGFENATESVSWAFNLEPGLYEVAVGYRTPNGAKGFGATIDGVSTSGMFPALNAFATFDLGLVLLEGNSHTASIGGGWNYYQIDYLEFIPATPPPPPLAIDPTPVDPQATPEARELLQFLVGEYGKRTLSGQQEAGESTQIEASFGVYPAVVTCDLIDYSPSRIEHGTNPTGYVESYRDLALARGPILSVMWHWNAPTDLLDTPENRWWSGFYTRATTFDLAQVLADPQSERYGLLLRDIDAIAVQLKKLQDAHIPVLWRPLHEAEGGWFWWGAKGPEPLVELWRLLYDRLTNHHGLHNLLWVFTVQDPTSHAWYPGDAYVDLVGKDAYPDDMSDSLSADWSGMRDEFDGRKLIALSEFGGVPSIDRMQQLGTWWSYFCSWTGDLGAFASRMPAGRSEAIYQSAGVTVLSELHFNASALGGGVASARPLWAGGQWVLEIETAPGAPATDLRTSTDFESWRAEYWPSDAVEIEAGRYQMPVTTGSATKFWKAE